MKTFTPKKEDVKKTWYIVDAKNQTLGRLATEIAVVLRGKNKPIFVPHMDCGDFVIVINAKEIKVTGNKLEDKMYYRHSGYNSGLKSTPLKKMLDTKPTEVIKKAVSGMLPKNKMRAVYLGKLKIFAGPEHAHEAQKPQPLTFK
jgi:large subunit ribosomal protein L13